MRSQPGLRQRLLIVILPLAALAVVLSALVTQAITKDQLQAQSAASQSAVIDINQTLNEYALYSTSWSDAGDLIVELSNLYSVRIALTNLDGKILVDSAASTTEAPRPLPAQIAGFIDPSIEAFNIDAPVEISSIWLADAAYQDCLFAAGVDQQFLQPSDRSAVDACLDEVLAAFPDAVITFSSPMSEPALSEPAMSEPALSEPAMSEPAMSEPALSEPAMSEPALSEPALSEPAIPEDGLLEDIASIQDPFSVATSQLSPALLFLGEAGQPLDVLEATFDYRMMMSIAAIALAAIAGTYVLARRILAPISTLTLAAHQVAAGGKPEPVPVVGDSELSDLAVAFNSMGAALRDEEVARRQLTTDIAHELRSPLQNIRGNLEAAQDGIRKVDLNLVDSVHEEALILQHLVDDLQILALADAAQLQMSRTRVPVNDLLLGAVRSYADRAADKGVELQAVQSQAVRSHANGLQDDAVILGDPIRLHQILTNLIDNAIRHTPTGGKIVVSADTSTEVFSDSPQATSTAQGSLPPALPAPLALCLKVSDNGEGIPVDFVPHVFDRFSRADSSRTRGTGGSGVGLAICEKLVQAHGGTIEVESQIGVGTTFLIRLPLADKPNG